MEISKSRAVINSLIAVASRMAAYAEATPAEAEVRDCLRLLDGARSEIEALLPESREPLLEQIVGQPRR